MSTAMPLVVVLGIITVLLVRGRDVRAWEAVIIGLFGFYTAMTPIGWAVVGLVNWLLGGFIGD
ncbi:hypothetical protein GCM10012287_49490 [Streptomyces daqingensis]|uniref:Uncharacterized protein n=1 Tax=Streptomyces daqingensis TaxID=1472640 RepID=A0ABQ2MRH7_9ACTN|nr:hypothetical protein [Streptomyces daqingensis]GGO56275.1 hypothetical protein GCM10012287_49490 [Streptomyces daqingensis]